MAQDLRSPPLPHLRQDNAMVLFVFHKRWPLAGEFLQHPGDGSRADIQMTGQGIAGYPLFFRTAQFEDRFEIVVDGFGRGRRRGFVFTKII